MKSHHARGACGRCRRVLKIETTFPDGPLCTTCYSFAVRTVGTCPSCLTHRLLPGMNGGGQRVCVDCAGITNRSYHCSRCPKEWALRCGVCEYCYLSDRLDGLLADADHLAPLRQRLLQAARPDSIIIWLRGSDARRLVTELAAGTIPLSHDGLDAFSSRRAADHLRSLLVDVGLLPPREELLARFDAYVQRLGSFTDHPEDLKVLEQFAQWHLRPELAAKAAHGPLRSSQLNQSTQQLRVAAQFLTWLRGRGKNLSTCGQADLDLWWATPPTTGTHVRTFVKWAVHTRRSRHLDVTYRKAKSSPTLPQERRLELLVKTLDPQAGSLQARAASMLLLLLAQPFHRMTTIRATDVEIDSDPVILRITNEAIEVPEPFGALLRELVTTRPNTNTATNPTSSWLFTGTRAGSHADEDSLRKLVRDTGVDLLAARNAALRQLVLDCPPPIVAELLGYSYPTIDHHAIHAGSSYASYAAIRTQRQTT